MARSWSISSQSENADPREGKGAYWALAVVTLVYAMNIADRFVLSTLIEPIKAEFQLSDASVGFLTGVALAIFYTRSEEHTSELQSLMRISYAVFCLTNIIQQTP